MLTDDKFLLSIDEKINKIGLEFAQVQGLILTEDDLKCKLYSELIQIPYLAAPDITKDHWIKASKVHAELSRFDLREKLAIKPDITILEPLDTSILHSVQGRFPFPSKGFHSIGNTIIFELKFIRDRRGITQRSLDTIRNDINKIKELYQKMEEDGSTFSLICYIVIFTKIATRHNNLMARFEAEMENDDRFRIFYRTGAVSFTDPT